MENLDITINSFNNSAENYMKKFMSMDLYNDTFDRFCELVSNKHPKILEIACGPGNVSSYLLSKRPDFRITGIDLAPKMIELARRNNPSVDYILMDCRKIKEIDKTFDAVMCSFCLPSLSEKEVSHLISDIAVIAKAGAVCYFSTMEGDYGKSGFEKTSFSGEDEIFIYYHCEEFLRKEFRVNGFELIEFCRKLYPEADGSFLTDMILIVKKK